MPSLLEQDYIPFNQPPDLAQFIAAKSKGLSQGYWAQPELGNSLRRLNMNVKRFLTFKAEKEKAITFDSKNGWHCEVLPPINVRIVKLLNPPYEGSLERLGDR
jgi:hypothetical protein